MARRDGKASLSVRINAQVLAEVRELVRRHAGHPDYARLNAFIESAIVAHLAAFKEQVALRERTANHERQPTRRS